MVYLYIEIYSYKQITKISPNIIDMINNRFKQIIDEGEINVIKNLNGIILLNFGDENKIEIEHFLESTFSFYRTLKKMHKFLHGFNLFIVVETTPYSETLIKKIENILFSIKEEEGVWIHKNKIGLLKNVHEVTRVGEYFSIAQSRSGVIPEKFLAKIQKIKKPDFIKLVNDFSKAKVRPKKSMLSFISSQQKLLARLLVENALKKLVGKNIFPYIPFVNLDLYYPHDFYSLVKSVNLELFKKIPQFITSAPLMAWQEKRELFIRLYNEKSIRSDRLKKDIFHAFHIYFNAYCEMMKRNFLPAILVCNAIESSSAQFRHYFAKCLSDFSHTYGLLIILISAEKDLPVTFTNVKIKKTEITPLSESEIRKCFHILYPKLNVPSGVVRQIQRFSGGNYYPVLHYIYYLRLQDKIQKVNNHYQWVPRSQLPLKLPANPLNLSLKFIKALKEEEKMILYTLYLSYNIFSYSQLITFLELLGLKEKISQNHLSYLKNTGLVALTPDNTPFDLKFRKLIKNSLGGKSNFIECKFLEYLEQNIYSYLPYHALSLIKLLLKLGDISLLQNIIIWMLQYTMDTFSFKESKSLLAIAGRLKTDKIKKSEQETLNIITSSGTLRYLLLTLQIKEAPKFIANTILKIDSSYTANPFHADLHLQLARYYLTQNDPEKSINEAKKAALFFQELSHPEKMSESYLELGQALLAKGSILEALDYFEFARKFSSEIGSVLLNVKAYFLKAIALFFIGNYTQVLNNIHSGLELAEINGLRQLEQLLLFFKARINFDLGLYETALTLFEQCLTMDRLYSFEESMPVIKAWIARTFGYLGEDDAALTLLGSLQDTVENLFFKAEILYFQKNYDKAVKILIKARHMKQKHCVFLAERFFWENGFSMIEDRRFDLTLTGKAIDRWIRCFEAYSSCFSDRLKEGLNELHLITMREKIPPLEPYTHIYYLFYYLILTKCSVPKDIDNEMANSLTVLNLALKHLQERSTAIDDPKHRIHYISKNYWNKILFQEAKQNRLL